MDTVDTSHPNTISVVAPKESSGGYVWGGAGSRRVNIFPSTVLVQYNIIWGSKSHIDPASRWEYIGQKADTDFKDLAISSDNMAIQVPLDILTKLLPFKSLRDLCKYHGIQSFHRSLDDIISNLSAHECNCGISVSLFKRRNTGTRHAHSLRDSSTQDDVQQPEAVQERVNVHLSFPPQPKTKSQLCTIMREFCNEMSSHKLSEGPCAVCARLCLCSDISHINMPDFDWSPLDRTGTDIGRLERHSADDKVIYLAGALLCPAGVRMGQVGTEVDISVCQGCLRALKSGKRPVLSLANGLWLGEVPIQLSRLNFVEKLLVARYRHNTCMVKVTMGQRRMAGNAVVFSQPVAKLYTKLPPPCNEMDECLTILFTGSCAPAGKDFKRTP
ncbi:DUF6570 domain-containing protein, partial [Aetokthonos hydrillicola]|uniref:DUF6570 domain-containing protein n=1 Tax=Aetokthonos hydrillicola TaxID=1550245 RepID=UPI001ABA0F18